MPQWVYPKMMHLPMVTLTNALDHRSFKLDLLNSYECLTSRVRDDVSNLTSLCQECFSFLLLLVALPTLFQGFRWYSIMTLGEIWMSNFSHSP